MKIGEEVEFKFCKVRNNKIIQWEHIDNRKYEVKHLKT